MRLKTKNTPIAPISSIYCLLRDTERKSQRHPDVTVSSSWRQFTRPNKKETETDLFLKLKTARHYIATMAKSIEMDSYVRVCDMCGYEAERSVFSQSPDVDDVCDSDGCDLDHCTDKTAYMQFFNEVEADLERGSTTAAQHEQFRARLKELCRPCYGKMSTVFVSRYTIPIGTRQWRCKKCGTHTDNLPDKCREFILDDDYLDRAEVVNERLHKDVPSTGQIFAEHDLCFGDNQCNSTDFEKVFVTHGE